MSVERAARALWARAVAATLPRPSPDAITRVRRVLFLRHDAIGDMLSSLGLLRALAEHGFSVDVLASPANAPVLAGNPWGIGVLQTATGRRSRRALARELAARRYDAVIDGLVLKPSVNSRTVRLLRASRAPVRIGTGGRAHDRVYSHAVATDLAANHVEVLASLLRPFGIEAERALGPVAMPLADAERVAADAWWTTSGAGRRLFVNLSASSAERRWPDERFIAALRAVTAAHPTLRLALSGSPDDWSAAREIATAVGGRAFAGSLREAFALLAAADAVLTPDTSAAHAAAGFGVPSVVLVPRGNLRFSPWRAPVRLVVAEGPAVDTISEGAVIAALLETMAAPA
jgi:ADP-heptose:LPS heptosyltransferase